MDWAEQGPTIALGSGVIIWLIQDRASLVKELREQQAAVVDMQSKVIAVHERYSAEKERAAEAYRSWTEAQTEVFREYSSRSQVLHDFVERVDSVLRRRLVRSDPYPTPRPEDEEDPGSPRRRRG